MIKYFDEISQNDFMAVGGKAYNLAKMKKQGIDIPDGFVIMANAYDEYIKGNDIESKINDIFKSDKNLVDKSKEIKNLFEVDKISNKLKGDILSSVDSKTRYAVRSSSTVEDLPSMSFAGQYSSYLNVSCDEILSKVCQCWRSLWNERAIEYRKKYDIDIDFSHCVIVQKMVESKVSGVVFTANPMTGLRSEIVVNSAFGLGEAIVSGEVNADSYSVSKEGGHLLKVDIAVKEKKCVYADNGIKYIENDEDKKDLSSLSDKNLADIVDQSRIIEEYFGCPQDIEFAIDKDDKLYILQSRDITTLFPIDNLKYDGKLRAYLVASSVLLAMKEAFTPLGADVYGGMFPTMINIMTAQKKPISGDFVRYEGGRILIDISYLLSRKLVAKQLGSVFSGNDLPLKAVMESVVERYGKTFSNQGIKFKIPWGMVKYAGIMIKNMKAAGKIGADDRYNAVKALGEQYYLDIKAEAEKIKTLEQSLDFCKNSMIKAFRLTQKQALYCTDVNLYAKVEKTVNKVLGDEFDLTALAYAFPDCFTVQMSLMLNEVAKYLDENDQQPTMDNPKVKEFFDVYGCRANVELDVGFARWSEQPDYILDLIKTYMTDNMYERNLADIYDKAKQASDLTEQIYQAIKEKKGEVKAAKIKKMIEGYRIAAGMREYPKFNIVQGLDVSRKVMIKQGKILVDKGLLDDAYDIFFLHKEDLLKGENYRAIVAENRAMYDKEMKRSSIPRIVLNTGETIYSAHKVDMSANVLSGIALSSGVYEGVVRVVRDPKLANLKEGEIMVTESTNPAWTPLFMAAKGLIMEYGGPLSHGGIVAREYGIPAVVGISSVTDRLKDGQIVRVNGDAGTVEILE